MIRRCAAALIIGTMLSQPVVANLPWWAPSPLTVAITAGKWLIKEREEVFYLQIRARGADDTAAREEAFRLAVSQAVGSLLNSEIEMRDGEVVRNDIVSYSSGYVHDYKILSTARSGSGVEIVIDVWVKKSSIADRLLNESKGTDIIPSDQISTQHRTILRERQTGDRLLEMVLADYPSKAFDIGISNIKSRMDPERNLVLEIDFQLTWNSRYLQSLHEAAQATATRQDVTQCVQSPGRCGYIHVLSLKYRHPGDFFIKGGAMAYDDNVRGRLFQRYFEQQNPHLQVRIHDGHGRDAVKQCFTHNELTRTGYYPARRFVHSDSSRTIVDGQLGTRGTINLRLPPQIQPGNKVELRIVPEQECNR